MQGKYLKRLIKRDQDVERFSWDTEEKREMIKPKTPDEMKKALFAAFGLPSKKK